MPYCQLNVILDVGAPRGALNYWKSSFLSSLSDEALRTMIDASRAASRRWVLFLEHFHGAVTRIGLTDTAFPHRSEGYNLLVISEWMDLKENDTCIAWARDAYAAVEPFMGSNRYVNYLADHERGDEVVTAHGPNYRRLRQIKAKYDPENFFHMNHIIRPSP